MTQKDFGPTNIQQNNSAFFTAEFIDSTGSVIVPSAGATLSVTYINTNNTSQTDSFVMTYINSFFTATWSTTSASRGLADWTIMVTGSSSLSQIGQIRVIDP